MAEKGLTNPQYYSDIASAIRSKAGITTTFKPSQLASAVLNIPNQEDEILNRTISGAYTNSRITTLGSYGLRNCSFLTTVNLPNCVSISSQAVCYCTSMSEFSAPKCKECDVAVFFGCTSLTKIHLPECTTFGLSCFVSCTALSEVSFDKCQSLGKNAFSNCTSLNQVLLENCTTVSATAFANCTALSIVYLPKCTTLDSTAFTSCTSLQAVFLQSYSETLVSGIFPSNNLQQLELGCVKLSASALRSCTKLHTLKVPNCTFITSTTFSTTHSLDLTIGLKSLNTSRFLYNYNLDLTTKLTLTNCTTFYTSTYSSYNIFYSCSSLKELYFLSTVTTAFNSYIFNTCTALERMSISCTTVAARTFNKLSNLQYLSLTCASLAGYVFPSTGATSLSVYLNCTALPTTAAAALTSSPFARGYGTIYVPTSLYSDFLVASYWSSISARIESYNF